MFLNFIFVNRFIVNFYFLTSILTKQISSQRGVSLKNLCVILPKRCVRHLLVAAENRCVNRIHILLVFRALILSHGLLLSFLLGWHRLMIASEATLSIQLQITKSRLPILSIHAIYKCSSLIIQGSETVCIGIVFNLLVFHHIRFLKDLIVVH